MWGSCLYCCCYVTLKTGGEATTTFFIDSGLMWGIAVPVAWCLVLFTDVSLLYIYATIVGIDILKFLVSYYFVKKEWILHFIAAALFCFTKEPASITRKKQTQVAANPISRRCVFFIINPSYLSFKMNNLFQ